MTHLSAAVVAELERDGQRYVEGETAVICMMPQP